MRGRRVFRWTIILTGVVVGEIFAYAQDLDSPSNVALPATKVCPQHVRLRQPTGGPEISIVGLSFSGFLQMPVAEQNEIAATIEQQGYSGSVELAKEEAEERLRAAWQNRGYFKVEVAAEASVLSSSPAGEQIALSAHVDEGPQYRLAQITFKNNRALLNVSLRHEFAIDDGDIFSREAIAKGLENLRRMYGQMGYINFTAVPETTFNDDNQTISLSVNVDEGKQFYIGSVRAIGAHGRALDELPELVKVGDIYNVRLIDLFLQRNLPGADANDPNVVHKSLDEQRGIVAITFDFRTCPAQ